MAKRQLRALEHSTRLAIRAATDGLVARRPAIGEGFLPQLALLSVISKPLHVLFDTTGKKAPDDGHNACMQSPATFLENAPVGYLVGQRVPERVFQIGEQPRS